MQVVVGPLDGCGHEPTSVDVVTLRTVPLCQPLTPVPLGRFTVIALPASPESPPSADTLKPIT